MDEIITTNTQLDPEDASIYSVPDNKGKPIKGCFRISLTSDIEPILGGYIVKANKTKQFASIIEDIPAILNEIIIEKLNQTLKG